MNDSDLLTINSILKVSKISSNVILLGTTLEKTSYVLSHVQMGVFPIASTYCQVFNPHFVGRIVGGMQRGGYLNLNPRREHQNALTSLGLQHLCVCVGTSGSPDNPEPRENVKVAGALD